MHYFSVNDLLFFNRFNSIFQYEHHAQVCIVIPGDNDVGGEYYGDKLPKLRPRFRNYFGETISLYRQHNIEFLKVSSFLRKFTEFFNVFSNSSLCFISKF